MSTNRRDALKNALLTAVGIGAVSKGGSAAVQDGAPAPKTEGQVVLYGVRLQISSQDLQRGELPPAGVRMLVQGEIFDKPSGGGQKTGDFFATYYRLNTPGKVAQHEPGSLELHTFVFADGTLVGSGVSNAALDSEGQFAVIGGTGRYHGARGSYLARQSHLGLGGDGGATFTLTLI